MDLKAEFDKVKKAHPEFNDDTAWVHLKEQLKESVGDCLLYVCDDCCKTFRSLLAECSCTSKNVSCISQKPKFVPAKIEEELKKSVVIASDITDKADADELARKKRGKVVQDANKKFSVIIQENTFDDDTFTTEVPYSIYSEETDDFNKGKATVVWKTDIEYRSWGIKGMDVSIVKPIMLSDGAKDITIDTDNIEIEWEQGYHLFPADLEYDKGKVTITFSYVAPDYTA